MPHAKVAKGANWISDFGFFPAVAGHADAWALDCALKGLRALKWGLVLIIFFLWIESFCPEVVPD